MLNDVVCVSDSSGNPLLPSQAFREEPTLFWSNKDCSG